MALFLWRFEIDPRLKPGTNYCVCGACGMCFGGVCSFEQHRVGPQRDRTCLGAAAMRGAGLELNPRGYWGRSYRVGL